MAIKENSQKFYLAAPDENPRCDGCGGPHGFDTSVPSVVWNGRIRYEGLPDYLCASCVLRVFAREGQSFTAVLYGADLHGVPIEVQVDGKTARDAREIQDENNALRCQIREAEAHAAALADRLTRYELKLREIYWLGHGCDFAALYGDDGEMQCWPCKIDFKRMPFDELERRVTALKVERLKTQVNTWLK